MVDDKHILDEIRKLVENEKLSFLIGAGFGKNISKIYPLWKELLADAIWNMCGTGRDSDRAKKEITVQNKVIKETGLLGVASKIVNDAGFHEAVDDYIEQHTPYLDLNDKDKPVLKKGKTELPDKPSFECHNLLRQLNIKNIYTFNYDNALEFCLGDKTVFNIQKATIQDELTEKCELYLKLETEYQTFMKDWESMDFYLENPNVDKPDVTNVEKIKATKSDFESKLKKLNSEIISLKGQLKNVSDKLDESYLVVTKSSDIALTDGGRNIYKIHGNLRKPSETDYGFDGDKHAQYVITKEDYDTYEQKHSAFVNLMRIDLLRKRFCIIGVSGGDANFLAWIGWVKDVLDKTGNENTADTHSFFIHAGGCDLSRDMMQMLKNHFIRPVILKDLFPDAIDDTERVTRFLNYIQPSINNTNRLRSLWENVDRNSLNVSIPMRLDTGDLNLLCDLSAKIVFHKAWSVIHHSAAEVQNSAYYYLKGDDIQKLKIFFSALNCSMLPAHPKLLKLVYPFVKNTKDKTVKSSWAKARRRQYLLRMPSALTKTMIAEDVYTLCLKRLFLYDFPTKEDCLFKCSSGLDYVRAYSLQMLLSKKSDIQFDENVVAKFESPQELVLAKDWIFTVNRNLDGSIVDNAKKFIKNYNTYHLSEYFESYLKEMREKIDPYSYGDVSEIIYIDGRYSGYENAAVILNSIVELGITFAGHNVLTDNDWIDVVHELRSSYPYPLAFYTIARCSKDGVIKRVAQELMYDNDSYRFMPDILVRMLASLVSPKTPTQLMGPIANFARELFVAVPVAKWRKIFEDIAIPCLDLADKMASLSARKPLYALISDGTYYINDKQFKINLLKRVLKTNVDDRIDDSFNMLAISAGNKLTVKDFEPLANDFVKYAKNGDDKPQSYIIINLVHLLDEKKRLPVYNVLEKQAVKNNYLVSHYAALIKDNQELSDGFKKKLVERDDVWQSGIIDDTVILGSGHVKLSRVDQLLHFNYDQIQYIYQDTIKTLAKVKNRLNNPIHRTVDQGMMSEENNYREMVADMLIFVKNHIDVLKNADGFDAVWADLKNTYYRCCFGKDILQMIADDKIPRAIRAMIFKTEFDDIAALETEYKTLIGCLLSRESNDINRIFSFLAWVVNDNPKFFRKNEFVKLLLSVLEAYSCYFVDGDSQQTWNIMGCEKEVAEANLMAIAKTLNNWGYKQDFWNVYKRKFYQN